MRSQVGRPWSDRGRTTGGTTTSSIATFSPPLKATGRDSLPRVLLAAIVSDPDGLVVLLASDGDGGVGLYPIHELTVDWRYDPATGLWTDVNDNASEGDEDPE